MNCTVSPIHDSALAPAALLEIVQLDRLLRITREERRLVQHMATRAMVRGVAHEIKNPLGGLRGAAQLLESELEKLRDSLTTANDAFNTVQGSYYKLGSDVARVEQAIKHHRESRQQQQQELQRAEETLGEVESHIRLDTERLAELAADLENIGPECNDARGRVEWR